MEFKKKLKSRLYIAVVYVAVGIMMIAGAFIMKTDNEFISSFGIILTVIGIARIKNYFMITSNEEHIRKQEIVETDERNLLILHKAKSTAFSVYVLILGAAVIILSFFGMGETAKWISYSVCLLVFVYWICYLIYQKKL